MLQQRGGMYPLLPAGGQLTDRYLNGIPADSRAASGSKFLNPEQITDQKLEKVRKLNALAEKRGQKLSQMALARSCATMR